MMTADDSMASAKYGPFKRNVGKPNTTAKTMATNMEAGKLHQGPRPKCTFRKPAA